MNPEFGRLYKGTDLDPLKDSILWKTKQNKNKSRFLLFYCYVLKETKVL